MHKWGYIRGPPSSSVCRKLWCWQLPPGSKRFFGGKIGPPLKTKGNVKWKNPESPINPPRSSASISVTESGSAEGDGGALPAAVCCPLPSPTPRSVCTLSPMVSPSRPRTLTASSSCCDRPVQFWPRGEPGTHVCVCLPMCTCMCICACIFMCMFAQSRPSKSQERLQNMASPGGCRWLPFTVLVDLHLPGRLRWLMAVGLGSGAGPSGIRYLLATYLCYDLGKMAYHSLPHFPQLWRDGVIVPPQQGYREDWLNESTNNYKVLGTVCGTFLKNISRQYYFYREIPAVDVGS